MAINLRPTIYDLYSEVFASGHWEHQTRQPDLPMPLEVAVLRDATGGAVTFMLRAGDGAQESRALVDWRFFADHMALDGQPLAVGALDVTEMGAAEAGQAVNDQLWQQVYSQQQVEQKLQSSSTTPAEMFHHELELLSGQYGVEFSPLPDSIYEDPAGRFTIGRRQLDVVMDQAPDAGNGQLQWTAYKSAGTATNPPVLGGTDSMESMREAVRPLVTEMGTEALSEITATAPKRPAKKPRPTMLRSADLRGLDLAYANLADGVFDKSYAVGIDLNGSNLRNISAKNLNADKARMLWVRAENSDFTKARLNGAHLAHAHLGRAQLRQAGLQGTTLVDLRADRADFTLSNATGADFRGSSLEGTRFDSAKLQGAQFTSSQARWASFVMTDCRNVDFRHMDLRGADFTDADLDGANFTGARLTDAIFDGAQVSSSTRISGADLAPEQQQTVSGTPRAPWNVSITGSLDDMRTVTKPAVPEHAKDLWKSLSPQASSSSAETLRESWRSSISMTTPPTSSPEATASVGREGAAAGTVPLYEHTMEQQLEATADGVTGDTESPEQSPSMTPDNAPTPTA